MSTSWKLDVKAGLAGLFPRRFISAGRSGGGPRIALTFDDGPHTDNTLPLLEWLDRFGFRATFFVTGQAVVRAPGILREIALQGHQVANHGYSHLNAHKVPYERYMRDIERANDVIEQALGKSIGRYMRPPYGALTSRTVLGLLSRRFRIVLWSVDSLDYSIHDVDCLQRNFATLTLRSGDIVLLHDDYAHTVKAMGGIADALRDRGLRSVTVSQILDDE